MLENYLWTSSFLVKAQINILQLYQKMNSFPCCFNNFAKILSNLGFIYLTDYLLIAAFPASTTQHFLNLTNKNCWSEDFNLFLKFAYHHPLEANSWLIYSESLKDMSFSTYLTGIIENIYRFHTKFIFRFQQQYFVYL